MFRCHASSHIWTRLIHLFILLINSVACTGKKQPAKVTTVTSLPMVVSSAGVETIGPVVITFASYEYECQLYEPLMAEFYQQNPDITVQLVALPENTFLTQNSFTNYPRLLATIADTTTSVAWEVVVGKQYADVHRLVLARASLSVPYDPRYDSIEVWQGQAVMVALKGEEYQTLLPTL